MASVVAVFQDGSETTVTGTWEEMQNLYDDSCKATPDNIRIYRELVLYDDAGIGIGSHVHLSEKQTRNIYADIRGTLRSKNLPLYGVSDDEVAQLIHFTREAFRDLGMAFIAYHITERQGGCWVFE